MSTNNQKPAINMHEFFNLIVRQEQATRVSEGELHKSWQKAFDPQTEATGTLTPASINPRELMEEVEITDPSGLHVIFKQQMDGQTQTTYKAGNPDDAERLLLQLKKTARRVTHPQHKII